MFEVVSPIFHHWLCEVFLCNMYLLDVDENLLEFSIFVKIWVPCICIAKLYSLCAYGCMNMDLKSTCSCLWLAILDLIAKRDKTPDWDCRVHACITWLICCNSELPIQLLKNDDWTKRPLQWFTVYKKHALSCI